MSDKLCPLDASGERCGPLCAWYTDYDQCAVRSVADSLRDIAESMCYIETLADKVNVSVEVPTDADC